MFPLLMVLMHTQFLIGSFSSKQTVTARITLEKPHGLLFSTFGQNSRVKTNRTLRLR